MNHKFKRKPPSFFPFGSLACYIYDTASLKLIDHPTAKKCYAWSYIVDDSEKRKFIAVLHQKPVDSPEMVVKAFIVSEYKKEKKGELTQFYYSSILIVRIGGSQIAGPNSF